MTKCLKIRRTNSSRNSALAGEITLVASESNDDVGAALTLELADPRLGLIERLGAGDVKDNNRSLCSAVVHGRQRVVPLLASTVFVFIHNTRMKPKKRQRRRKESRRKTNVSQISNLTVVSLRQTVCVRNAAVDRGTTCQNVLKKGKMEEKSERRKNSPPMVLSWKSRN